jgi:hypothetical protein
MIEKRQVTVDEMILAFLQADVETPTDRREWYDRYLAGVDRAALIHRGDAHDQQQNDVRRCVLGAVRGYGLNIWLFVRFPSDTGWRLVTVTPAEVKSFKYAKCDPWAPLSGGSRLVADGVKNLDRVQYAATKGNVFGIADRLRQGARFPALIAVQRTGSPEVVLMEGHTRATAYAMTDMPQDIEVIIGTSAKMGDWPFH